MDEWAVQAVGMCNTVIEFFCVYLLSGVLVIILKKAGKLTPALVADAGSIEKA